MRILQVCKKFPFPVRDGEGVAVRALAKGLVEAGCTMDLLSFNTSKHYVVDPQAAELPHYDSISTCELDNDITHLSAGLSFLKPGSFHVSRFDSDAFRVQLRTLLELRSYDAVILETSILAIYIPVIRRHSKALVVIRAHNLEHEIWSRIAKRGPWVLRPAYRSLAKRLYRFEQEHIQHADLLLPITRRDAEAFTTAMGYQGPLHAVPVGYDAASSIHDAQTALSRLPFAISFIGSLDWAPNLEGLKWFLAHIWPVIHAALPEVRLHVAGRKTPRQIEELRLPGVTIHGEVPDSQAFLRRYPVTVAPILSGSGTRVKILDAMKVGRVVLTTSMGLEGIDAQDQREVIICHEASCFVEQLSRLQAEPMLLDEIGANASAFIADHFDFARIGFGVASQIRDCLRERMFNSELRLVKDDLGSRDEQTA